MQKQSARVLSVIICTILLVMSLSAVALAAEGPEGPADGFGDGDPNESGLEVPSRYGCPQTGGGPLVGSGDGIPNEIGGCS